MRPACHPVDINGRFDPQLATEAAQFTLLNLHGTRGGRLVGCWGAEVAEYFSLNACVHGLVVRRSVRQASQQCLGADRGHCCEGQIPLRNWSSASRISAPAISHLRTGSCAMRVEKKPLFR